MNGLESWNLGQPRVLVHRSLSSAIEGVCFQEDEHRNRMTGNSNQFYCFPGLDLITNENNNTIIKGLKKSYYIVYKINMITKLVYGLLSFALSILKNDLFKLTMQKR